MLTASHNPFLHCHAWLDPRSSVIYGVGDLIVNLTMLLVQTYLSPIATLDSISSPCLLSRPWCCPSGYPSGLINPFHPYLSVMHWPTAESYNSVCRTHIEKAQKRKIFLGSLHEKKKFIFFILLLFFYFSCGDTIFKSLLREVGHKIRQNFKTFARTSFWFSPDDDPEQQSQGVVPIDGVYPPTRKLRP